MGRKGVDLFVDVETSVGKILEILKIKISWSLVESEVQDRGVAIRIYGNSALPFFGKYNSVIR